MKYIASSLIFFFLYFASSAQDHTGAQPVGGKQQLIYFIEQEIVYPEQMYNDKIEGTVSFLFDINETGHITAIKDIKTPDSAALAEALRIFRLIEWIPANNGGIKVPDTKLFEIEFDISKYNRICRTRGYKNKVNPFEPVDTSLKIYWYRNLDSAPKPVFIDQKENLAVFIANNLQYPELAIRQNVTGVVKINFIVETNGRASNVTIENSVGAGCNEEAIRILRMLKWMPGIYEDKAVRTRTSLSINFSLDRGKDGIFNPVVKSSYGG
ncbi:MAG TPA: energy transducer TonB [Lentimicrobium sp.]|nr:energy transducer TonB [Lentimicrobium sp.]